MGGDRTTPCVVRWRTVTSVTPLSISNLAGKNWQQVGNFDVFARNPTTNRPRPRPAAP